MSGAGRTPTGPAPRSLSVLVTTVVLVDDITDGPELAATFFEHHETLAARQLTLVDEVALGTDELRSLAITTFTDEPGWDDVSARIEDLDSGDDDGWGGG